MKQTFEDFSTRSAKFAGRPIMLVIAVMLSVFAAMAFAYGDDHILGGASLALSMVTLLLLPILQATQNRDSAALHAKLDELIKIHAAARDTLIGLEERSTKDIEAARQAEERGSGQ